MCNNPQVLTFLLLRNAHTSLLTTCALHKNAHRTYNSWSLRQRYTACHQFGKPRKFLYNYTSNKHDNRQKRYVFGFLGVCFFRSVFNHTTLLIAIHKSHWKPLALNSGHITHNYKTKTFISRLQKYLTKSIIFSHLYPRSVAPQNAPSSAKCNVHFRVPRNWKSITKSWRLTSL